MVVWIQSRRGHRSYKNSAAADFLFGFGFVGGPPQPDGFRNSIAARAPLRVPRPQGVATQSNQSILKIFLTTGRIGMGNLEHHGSAFL
jgi:hypothetical protein